jgi:hypothetical protein
MKFRVVREIRGGRLFPNGEFNFYGDAVKQRDHVRAWHRANRTSAVVHIFDEQGKLLGDDYVPPNEEDVDDTAPQIEEDTELRIMQLEEENQKLRQKLLKHEKPVAVVQDGEEEA